MVLEIARPVFLELRFVSGISSIRMHGIIAIFCTLTKNLYIDEAQGWITDRQRWVE